MLFGSWIMRHLLPSFLKLELANGALNIEAFNGSNKQAGHIEDETEANESDNYLIRLNLIHTLKQVADLGEPDRGDLDQAEEEGGRWLRELFRMAENVFHHIDAVSSLWKALPMQDQHGEEQAEVQWRAILIADIEFLEEQNRKDEG